MLNINPNFFKVSRKVMIAVLLLGVFVGIVFPVSAGSDNCPEARALLHDIVEGLIDDEDATNALTCAQIAAIRLNIVQMINDGAEALPAEFIGKLPNVAYVGDESIELLPGNFEILSENMAFIDFIVSGDHYQMVVVSNGVYTTSTGTRSTSMGETDVLYSHYDVDHGMGVVVLRTESQVLYVYAVTLHQGFFGQSVQLTSVHYTDGLSFGQADTAGTYYTLVTNGNTLQLQLNTGADYDDGNWTRNE